MCGICAYIGYSDGYDKAMNGIMMLQNRGYDSCGVSSIIDNEIYVTKYASTNDMSGFTLVKNHSSEHKNSTNIMFHNRWSTHGEKTDKNAHPHVSYNGDFSLCHNGIIENYFILKNKLIKKYNIAFKSETDTEVIVNLISLYYSKYNDTNMAISKALSKLEGTWGLCIQHIREPNKIYCVRHGSPILIGINEDEKFVMIASEQSAFNKYVKNYICINDNDLVCIEKINNNVIINKSDKYTLKYITENNDKLTPSPFPHWTLKEIFEQYESIQRSLGNGGRIDNNYVKLGGLQSHDIELKYLDNLIILACGTSYNASEHCLQVFKEISGFNTVSLFDGADFNVNDIPKQGKSGIMFISQSGETKDLLNGLKIAKEHKIFTIGVINVVDSYIAREVNCGVYLNAGREVGVASTKSFTSQVVVLYLIATYFSQIRNINYNERQIIIQDLIKLPIDVHNIICKIVPECEYVADKIKDDNSLFLLGKGNSSSIAKEGALKIKELSYIHAEGYSSNCLKHGPYALIDNDTNIIVINNNDEHHSSNNSTIEEVKSRNAFVIEITDVEIENKSDYKIIIPSNKTFGNLLSVIPLQLIAYRTACLKQLDCDKPRHLAKCVTV